MITTIFILTGILAITIIVRACNTPEYSETVTTTYDEERLNVVGALKLQEENGQPFVIDPVDQKKIWVNSNDDMYEDADGKIWRLV